MSCSLSICADSLNSSLLIHDGTAQCSLGINSVGGEEGGKKRNVSGCGRSMVSEWWCGTVETFRLGLRLRFSLELVVEWLVVEERPWVVEFAVPRSFQVPHRLHHAFHLRVSYQCQ